MEWSKGYVADIAYTAGFYRETAPSHVAFAALMMGRAAGGALRPRRLLELGFGQGFGLALLAAANPDVACEGYDFNPEHVANARRMIAAAGLTNLEVTETSFEDAVARGADGSVDFIVAHGILSWVDADTRQAMLAIARRRLAGEGVMYASYNCMPGWSPLAPIRQLMIQAKKRTAGRSDTQLNAALDLVTKLRAGNAGFFAANPIAAQHVDQMLKLNRTYLAHEYLDEHWSLFQFAEVAAMMGEAKLGYHGSASLLENIDTYAVPATLAQLVAETSDPVLKETLRDFAANRRFRRDIYARGIATPTIAEHRKMLSRLAFVLTVPKQNVAYKFGGPLFELNAREDMHRPVIEALGSGVTAFDDLVAVFPGGQVNLLLDCLALQVSSGQVLAFIADNQPDPAPAQRFNRMVVDSLKEGRIYNALAAPAARTGLPVDEFHLIAFAAFLDGAGDKAVSGARHALALIKAMGRRPTRDGQVIEDDATALQFLEERLGPYLAAFPPIWRRLGIIPS